MYLQRFRKTFQNLLDELVSFGGSTVGHLKLHGCHLKVYSNGCLYKGIKKEMIIRIKK